MTGFVFSWRSSSFDSSCLTASSYVTMTAWELIASGLIVIGQSASASSAGKEVVMVFRSSLDHHHIATHSEGFSI